MKGLLTAFIIIGTGATAQERCGQHAEIVARLGGEYGEVRVSVATAGAPERLRMVEIFANPETGTWTTVVTSPDMRSCLSMAGQNFEAGQAGVKARIKLPFKSAGEFEPYAPPQPPMPEKTGE